MSNADRVMEDVDRDKVWMDFQLDAAEWIAEHGTAGLVAELRKAVSERRRVKLGTTNALILLAHIDGLESDRAKLADEAAELANEAARAVTEPRRFQENEDNRQQELAARVSRTRSLMRKQCTATTPTGLRCTKDADHPGRHNAEAPVGRVPEYPDAAGDRIRQAQSRVRSFIHGMWGLAGDARVRPALEALDELERIARGGAA